MRKFWERILTANRVIFGNKIMVLEISHEKKKNRLAVTLWSTIDSVPSQIEYLDAMAKELKYEQQQQLEKVRNFQAVNN